MSPAEVTSTGSRGTRVIGSLVLAGIVFHVLVSFVWSDPDADQGDLVRIMYVHVPSAWLAYMAFTVTAFGGVMYLWKRSLWWDLVAGASAEIGVVFCALALVTGSIWGRPTWGTYWEWDGRHGYARVGATHRQQHAPRGTRAARSIQAADE